MSHVTSIGDVTAEERASYDLIVSSILGSKPDMGAAGWASDAADASERALHALDLRRKLFPVASQS